MSIRGKYVTEGQIAWLHFNIEPGQTQCGDYGYQQAYAPNRSEKIEDGEVYVKVIIKEIVWKYNSICFNLKTVNKDGTEVYLHQTNDPDRLTIITE